MLSFIGGIFGLIFGGIVAYRRKGDRMDIAHYALVCGMIGFVLGVIAMLIIPAP
jgi:hypothetical protein